MNRIAIAVILIAGTMSGCSYISSVVVSNAVGPIADAVVAKTSIAKMSTTASAADVSSAIDQRVTALGWKKATAVDPWTVSYTHGMMGITTWFYGNAYIRYDLSIPASGTAGATEVQGRCMFADSTDSQPEQRTGKCFVQLQDMLNQIKQQLEQPKTTVKS